MAASLSPLLGISLARLGKRPIDAEEAELATLLVSPILSTELSRAELGGLAIWSAVEATFFSLEPRRPLLVAREEKLPCRTSPGPLVDASIPAPVRSTGAAACALDPPSSSVSLILPNEWVLDDCDMNWPRALPAPALLRCTEETEPN